ncbi:transposase [Ktedonobacter robiniae]|uniref:Transposase n=1 Tax=Ktedonobacter robiniae TaxID=2778365 RepID=A0ABQ3V6Q3_9CHLR|nr:transposase [Ktedonobacter robiniae]
MLVEVRRFFCPKKTCQRKIFAERFPFLALPHAQRTIRLQQTLQMLGFALGGQAGARVSKQLHLKASRDTILRLVRQRDLPAPEPPRVVGVDEWAWKRRLRYGTLLCDLERRIPLDILPDRRVETVAAWFKRHPSIEVISRDRSAEFAAAASQGAPQAIQVADRWHLGKNLSETLTAVLARCQAEQRRANRANGHQEEPLREPSQERSAYRSRREEQARLARKAEREQRYELVRTLHLQGLKTSDIAKHVGMGERTVRDWLAHGSYPEPKRRRRRPSLVDRYEREVLKRWEQGNHNGASLYRELRAQGYRGSQKALYRYLARLRAPRQRSLMLEKEQVPAGPLERLSAGRITRLFLRKSVDLSQEEQEELFQIRQASPEIEAAYQLVQTVLQMLRERTGQHLETWLKAAETSHIPEFESFAAGVRQDQNAILAGLTLPWSSGQTEGQITRLKLLKRSMYGRAKFDLLRLRVLHRAEDNPKVDKTTRKVHHRQQDPATVPRSGEKTVNSQHTTAVISEVA